MTTDTVAETLLFAARLKNPGISLVEARNNVARVLTCLKLTHIANSSDTLDSDGSSAEDAGCARNRERSLRWRNIWWREEACVDRSRIGLCCLILCGVVRLG